ncbi:hypothetical protein F2P81_003186 [Scophthalmus maximus]|uniref:G-protein coupled receptor 113 n=1 Tax=Scophthalmus maximus TaxID=52904 RepID=A0A6A4THS0_SCOMX|nr:hypothetical protein F2P81_003186 [Scophthalmus maximus]
MAIAYEVNSEDLINKSQILTIFLNASLHLETTGFVYLRMPDNPVKYGDKQELICKSMQDFQIQPVWQLKKTESKVFVINNGREAAVTSEPYTSKLSLKNITEVWAACFHGLTVDRPISYFSLNYECCGQRGEYTCAYHQRSTSYDIAHKASAVMDVALLPIIHITTVPSFPRCQSTDDLAVLGKCEIRESIESYTVKWTSQNTEATIIPLKPDEPLEETVGYTAQAVVGCHRMPHKPQLTCTFHNRHNQSRKASVDINIIYVGDKFCRAEGEWKETKAGFTAVLKCKNTVGQRRRKCNDSAAWEEEVEVCVNVNVTNALQQASMVDIGVGLLDENVADLFSRFQNITNETEAINTFSNVQASVDVLVVLGYKLNSINNDTTVDDLLDSSSNLMAKSLAKSWNGTVEGNLSLAETYLGCFEKLIAASNITANNRKTNIEVDSCNKERGSICTNTAFGVTVKFDSADSGTVKTTGIKQLGKYLPQTDKKYKLNSIIVSTTAETKQLDSVKVEIDFKLERERPRNVEIKCVYWDNTTRQWSEDGCEWSGPWGSGGRCICSHLSSFAILMAREPIELAGLSEITFVGLSISVVSLVISLAIEFTVWSAVVKTNTLYLRHLAHVNISLCLLLADCCFLASSKPQNISETMCKTLVVLKHFCYLSMFFWMLCLSSTLLHQAVFLFHIVSKKDYLRFSLILGYACPLIIVVLTFLLCNGGTESLYYNSDTCWLVYNGLFKGSLHSFLVPVGIIVFLNVFSMLVVIMKLLDHPKSTETRCEKERMAAKTIMRTVILLTPIFGVTWIFGFGVTFFDLSSGDLASVANYAFSLLNSFQGLFILLTTCLGDTQTREALLNRFQKKVDSSISESSTKLDTT